MSSRIAIRLLLIAMVAQVGYVVGVRPRSAPPHGPTTGLPLPVVPVRELASARPQLLNGLLVDTHECAIVVLMSVDCSFCKRMRHFWLHDFAAVRDSVHVPIGAFWVFPQSGAQVTEFVSSYPTAGIHLLTTPRSSFDKLGVFGTPISYVINPSGHLRLGLAGNQVPAARELAEACSDNFGD